MPYRPKISPCLIYPEQAEAAARFYADAFPNSAILNVIRYGKDSYGPEGSVHAVRLMLDGQELILGNGGPQFSFTQGISLYVECDTQEEIDHLWEALSRGGRTEQCGWLVDPFGVSWQIAPKCAWDWCNDPDPAIGQRVMRAIFGMRKLDIATLERAYRGE
jgi:predicted 3-demethylubiquinone-9 3-methyltransferase (glyoxalase superfamily)